MRQSQLFTKTRKEVGKDDLSINYKFLVRGGFINREMAGVYSFLPFGLRVLKKISQIVREEMDKVGGQEVFMPALNPKGNWEKTGRWEGFDALFKLKSKHGNEYALGPTHEEIIVPLSSKFINSYKDLPKLDKEKGIWPKAVYQIQTKFRDEPRAKSGLLRGREFLMKDLYSFHQTKEDLEDYYQQVSEAYKNIYERVGLKDQNKAILTEASGGTFSKLSHEFQVETEAGEDIIYYCDQCKIARNKEIVDGEAAFKCHQCKKETKELKVAEAGNIFKLNTKFSEPFELTYTDEKGQQQMVYMGCYGMGISRLMGVIVEVSNDEHGIIWPESVAPYQAHLLVLNSDDASVKEKADKVYADLAKQGIEILYDDRSDLSPGEKFAEADLIGCPVRLVVSRKAGDKIEVKKRDTQQADLYNGNQLYEHIRHHPGI